jgi:hypothetical protein
MSIVVAPATRFHPASTVTEDVFGDSKGTISGTALAQSFRLRAEGTSVHGDADIIARAGSGGDDHLLVTGLDSAEATLVFGDARLFVGRAHGGDDDLVTRKHAIAFGDAFQLTKHSVGGNDRIEVPAVAPTSEIQAYGDGSRLEQFARGGDDRLYGNFMIGDAGRITDDGRGGDDRMFGRGRDGLLFGDAVIMEKNARGGDDHLIANGRFTVLIGDANEMNDRAIGGDDYLHSKVGGGSLYGDAQPMTERARGGNDVLSGSEGSETLYGDALFAIDRSRCGNDILLGGKGNDFMYGDADSLAPTVTKGADRFVFAGQSGQDWIGDFQRGLDRLDVRAIGYTGFGQLTIDQVGDDSVVHFHGANEVTVAGVTGLTASDFLFA